MNNIIEFTEVLVKELVKNEDMVTVKEFASDTESEETVIQIMVDDTDMGALIGREGKTANAIRTVVQVAAYKMGIKKVKINIDSF